MCIDAPPFPLLLIVKERQSFSTEDKETPKRRYQLFSLNLVLMVKNFENIRRLEQCSPRGLRALWITNERTNRAFPVRRRFPWDVI